MGGTAIQFEVQITNHLNNYLQHAGALLLQHSGLDALDFFDDVTESYGLDVDGPVSSNEGNVVVPQVAVSLDSGSFSRLKQAINPLASSDDFGIDIFEDVLQFMSTV